MYKKLLYGLLLVILVTSVWMPALAQPSISGNLTGTFGPGEYIVEGNCIVPEGEELYIEPGTTFLFDGHFSILVYGQISALGTENDHILFKRLEEIEDDNPGGVRIQNTSSGLNSFQYCDFEYCSNNSYPNFYGGAIYCNSADLQVESCSFTGCNSMKGAGVYAVSSTIFIDDCNFELGGGAGGGVSTFVSEGTILNCNFSENSSSSLFVDGSPLTIDNCIFSQNTNGITVYSSATTIRNCEFIENHGGNGVGLLLLSCNEAIIENCTFTGNTSNTT
ncbi:MAG: hypothetical protein H8E46_09175 [FCB group bacterium]|nr:hypothetical protein [FCB group bacterium]